MPISPGAQPWAHDGGPVAVLLVHGFLGSPQVMRPWGRALASRGMTVRIPRLPGHGTSWREANLTRWEDWYAEVDRTLTHLRAEHPVVVAAGLGTGATLVLRLAQRRPDKLAGIVLVNPSISGEDPRDAAIPLVSRAVASWPAAAPDIRDPDAATLAMPDRVPSRALASLPDLWRVVRPDVPAVRTPALIVTSAEDHVVDPADGDWIASTLGSADVTRMVLASSYHLAPLDCDREALFEASAAFIARVTAQVDAHG